MREGKGSYTVWRGDRLEVSCLKKPPKPWGEFGEEKNITGSLAQRERTESFFARERRRLCLGRWHSEGKTPVAALKEKVHTVRKHLARVIRKKSELPGKERWDPGRRKFCRTRKKGKARPERES